MKHESKPKNRQAQLALPLNVPLEWILAAPTGFWTNVKVGPDDACWLWQRSLNSGGYGNYWDAGKMHLSHLVAFRAAHGQMPDGHECGHRCNNAACSNPRHLEPVTTKANAEERGLRQRGRPARVLTAAIVIAARKLRAAGWKIKAIAAKFKILAKTMGNAIAGRSWAWVSDEVTA